MHVFSHRMDKLQVVVVGAGAAGLAAAARLMAHGVRNVILEAEDRMGGRIHTALFGKQLLLLYFYFATLVTDQECEIDYISIQFF